MRKTLRNLQVALLLSIAAATAHANTSVRLAWNPNPEPNITGYRLHLGTSATSLDDVRDVGAVASTQISGLSHSTTYFAAIRAVNAAGLSSPLSTPISFTTPSATNPTIVLSHSGGTALQHQGPPVSLGSSTVGKPGSPLTFSILNSGNANLTGIQVQLIGSHAADFSISTTPSTLLGPGISTKFDITFTPSAEGLRSAAINIISNDQSNSPFVIPLTGVGSKPSTTLNPEISFTLAGGIPLDPASAAIAFGSRDLLASPATQSFSITNIGNASLTNLSASISGPGAADYSLTALPRTSLSIGSSIQLTLSFKPGATGSRPAVLRILSNDPDEGTFDIALSGTGIAAPAIAITRSDGNSLTSGSSTLAFTSLNLGAPGVTTSLIVRNAGSASLTGISLSLLGSHPGDFAVSTLPSTIAPGGNSSFTITFRPLAAGSRSAILRVASNDSTLNPFSINLAGTGIATPAIALTRTDGSLLTSGSSTLPFSSLNLGSAGISENLIIRNAGTASLTGISFSIVGSHPGDFTVSSLPSSITPGGNSPFTLTFKPLAAGNRSAILRISSNDPTFSRFSITLSGTGTTAPAIGITRSDGIPLTSGSSTLPFNSLKLGSSGISEVLRIRNSGTASLTGISFSLVGSHPGDFTVLNIPSSIAPGGDSPFTVTFKPLAAGTRSATLRITSNDATFNPFSINLAGTGISTPTIAITSNDGSPLVSGSSTLTFGPLGIGSSRVSAGLIVRNSGTASLTGVSFSLLGSHPGDFSISPLPTSIAPGGNAPFTITFKPFAIGTRSAILRIASNDAAFNSFSINLAGTGINTPTIGISRKDGSEMTSGSSTLSFASNLGGSGVTESLIIRNSGTANLTAISYSLLGSHPGDFSVSTLPASITPGGNSTFTITFQPLAAGPRSAILRIASNDPTFNPFSITLTGNGIANPKIAVELQNGINLINGVSTVPFGALTLGAKSTPNSLFIRNTGSAPLTGLAFSVLGSHPGDFTVSTIPTFINPSGETPFTITFRPLAAGNRSAFLRISSNDATANPFDIPLTGIGVAVPEISISNHLGLDLKSDVSVIGFSPQALNSAGQTLDFLVNNIGTASLTGITATVTGSHAGDFNVMSYPSSTVEHGQGSAFTVRFRPLAPGSRTAQLRIASNDTDENPFIITLEGNAKALPKIEVTQQDGSTTLPATGINFGSMDLGSRMLESVIRIHNRGTGSLQALAANLGGPHAADFSLSSLSSTSVAPGENLAMLVRFHPSAGGARNALLRLTSNDPDQPIINIPLTGIALTYPQIQIADSEAGIIPPTSPPLSFGSTSLEDPDKSRTLTIRNTGNGVLTRLSAVVDGASARDFRMMSNLPTALAPGASAVLRIEFTPSEAGTRSATLRISSSDPKASSYAIPLAGTGVATPSIVVRSGGELENDDSVLAFSSNGSTRSVTVINRGSAPLSIRQILISGPHANDFRLTDADAETLAPGRSMKFGIRLSSSARGIRWASLRIDSNDPTQRRFTVVLSGNTTSNAKQKKSAAKFALSTREPSLDTTTSFTLIDGQRYRTLTIVKQAGRETPLSSIEVSGNLVDWKSGQRHLTILKDTATILTVRDNIPFEPTIKRYIRLKP